MQTYRLWACILAAKPLQCTATPFAFFSRNKSYKFTVEVSALQNSQGGGIKRYKQIGWGALILHEYTSVKKLFNPHSRVLDWWKK